MSATAHRPATFFHKDLEIERAKEDERQPRPKQGELPHFGHFYADHMVEIDWTAEAGWGKPKIHALRPLSLHPGSKVLHCATEVFEGLKAYRGVDDRIRLFRPELNMKRLRHSAKRASLPDFDDEELLKIICELIKLDQSWVPHLTSAALYIRPAMIATDKKLGIGHSNAAKLFVITSPTARYYAHGAETVSLLADATHIRAVPGGTGCFKMGANYASTIATSQEAAKKGCQQVLWLFGDQEDLTEAGNMNVFVFWKNEQGEDELITAPLTGGLILPGITRQSLLDLARDWGEFKVTEDFINMHQIESAVKEERLYEMFGSGTATVISPVGKILYHNKNGEYEELSIPTTSHEPNLLRRLRQGVEDIQFGRVEKPGWTRVIQ